MGGERRDEERGGEGREGGERRGRVKNNDIWV